jgi:hypothetical protein
MTTHHDHRSARSWRRSLVAVALAVIAVAAVAPSPASAHAGNQSYLYLDITDKAVGGRVEMPMQDVKDVLGIDLLEGGADLADDLEAATPALQAYVSEHLALGADGVAWPIRFTTVEPLADDPLEPNRNYVYVDFIVDQAFDPVPRLIDVTFDPFFDDIDNRDGLLLIGNDVQAGIVNNAEEVFVRFTSDSRTQTVSLDDTSWVKNLKASTELGVDHIKTGPDHILFIFVLLLPAVLVFGASRWTPAASFRSALWRILKVASMFTLAHTITFSLAGLDVLPLPPAKVTEAVIALSIAAAAIHNLRPVFINKEWAIAFGFGLFHGMGFASLVGNLDTSRSVQLISLLGRNIGIEIGQAIVILVAFPALFLLRRTRLYLPLFTAASIGLVIVSLGWMYERVFEHDLGINDAIAPWLDVQKAALPLLVITLAAAAYQRYEGTRGRLLPVFDTATDEFGAVDTSADRLAEVVDA